MYIFIYILICLDSFVVAASETFSPVTQLLIKQGRCHT